MRVSIVGSRGFVGRHLVDHLRRAGNEIQELSSQGGAGIDPQSGVFIQEPRFDAGTDVVVYLAQSPFYRELPAKLPHMYQVNVVAATQAAVAARAQGVRKFIYASTGSVYKPSFQALSETDPIRRDDGYALSKIHAEEVLGIMRSANFEVSCVRLFGVYGLDQTDKLVPNLAARIKERKAISLAPHPLTGSDGGLCISLCHIDDVCRVFEKACSASTPAVFNLGSDEALNIRDIATMIGQKVQVETCFEVGSVPRSGDLIANLSQLRSFYKGKFRSFSDGLASVQV